MAYQFFVVVSNLKHLNANKYGYVMKQNAENQDRLKSEISPVKDHLGFLFHIFPSVRGT